MSQSDKQIKKLIKLYQTERRSLIRFIAGNTKEWEYLIAHYYSRRLQQVNRELQILNYILDPNHFDKEFLTREIKEYTTELELTDHPELRQLYAVWIRQAKIKLRELSNVSHRQNSPIVSALLKKLVDKQLTRLTLILNKEQELSIVIAINKKLRVSIPNIKTLEKNNVIFNNQIESLQYMGFQWNKRSSALSLLIEGSENELVLKVMDKLAKVVFKIFGFEEMKGQSYVKCRRAFAGTEILS